ncbi:MAG: ribonuclease III domain-containing protein [Clostridia bacterium]|nr:ribonuclease III domain-containing protein [Clostridia bacterium]
MLTNKKPSQFSPLALAYIGDGVYELFVRTKVIEEHENMPANKLHKKTVQYVKAHAQANSIDAMLPHLTEDETAVYKRGRNAKSNTTPKNADMADYRKATGFEALIGFLYLSGENERLHELMNIAYENALEK